LSIPRKIYFTRLALLAIALAGLAACASERSVSGGGSEHGGSATGRIGFPITF